MQPEELNEFAASVVKHIRDNAVRSMYTQLYTTNSPIAKRWHEQKVSGNIDRLSEMLISDSVDDTIFYLLNAIDNGDIIMSFKANNKKEINLTEEGLGELGGGYIAEWRSEYSKEPCFNDLKQ
jgi:hypothetical protein